MKSQDSSVVESDFIYKFLIIAMLPYYWAMIMKKFINLRHPKEPTMSQKVGLMSVSSMKRRFLSNLSSF